MILVNHHLLLHAEEALKVDQAVKELRGLFRVEGELCPVLLRIDRQITDHLPVLLGKMAELERDGEVFPEMELADVVEISRIVAVVPVQRHGKEGPFPLARHVGKVGFRVDDHLRFRRSEHLFQQFGESGEFKSGIFCGMIRLGPLLRFDRILRMVQTGGDRMAAERSGVPFAGARRRIRSVRESADLHPGDAPLVIAEDRPKDSRKRFMTAEKLPVSQNAFCLLECFL